MDPTLIKNSRAIYVSLQLSGGVLRCAYMCLSWSDFIKIDLFLLTCSFKLRDFKRFYICKNSQNMRFKCVKISLKICFKFAVCFFKIRKICVLNSYSVKKSSLTAFFICTILLKLRFNIVKFVLKFCFKHVVCFFKVS